MLPMLAGWAYVLRHRRRVLRALMSFEAAFAEMVRLEEEGKLSAAPAVFSSESLARVKRLCELVRPGLHTKDVKKAVAEIGELAELLYEALTGRDPFRRNMDAQEYATKVAQMLSEAMNASSLIESAEQGHAIDGPLLHQLLGSLTRELAWLDANRGPFQLQGLAWPADIADRVARLASELDAWKPSDPVPPGVLTAGRECLRFMKP